MYFVFTTLFTLVATNYFEHGSIFHYQEPHSYPTLIKHIEEEKMRTLLGAGDCVEIQVTCCFRWGWWVEHPGDRSQSLRENTLSQVVDDLI